MRSLAQRRLQQIETTAKRQSELALSPDIEADYRRWLPTLFPGYVGKPFAQRHHNLWRWVWAIEEGRRSRPFVGIWPRGGGKSTSCELAVAALGALKRRKYCVYVRRTQEKADESISNIAALIESSSIDKYYSDFGRRMVGKFGNAKGWRRERLRTASGFTVDALGLDSASRGAKADEQRPDLIILDDIDNKHDSPKVAQKHIDTLTTSILPAGSTELVVLAVQNLIIPHGFFAQLANGKADYLADRIMDGPYPAVQGLQYEQRTDPDTGLLRWYITEGQSTWDGQSLEVCQNQITDWGLMAFRQESQHEVNLIEGGMYDGFTFQHVAWADVPPLVRVEVWLDPAVSSNEDSDCQGIQADGIDEKKNLYRLWSWEGITSPEQALKKAILKANELNARAVGVETDQGGDAWQGAYTQAYDSLKASGELPADAYKPSFKSAKAGSIGSKIERANMMRADYDRGQIYHVIGTHGTLENALYRFPVRKPYDLHDAAFWGWYFVKNRGGWTR